MEINADFTKRVVVDTEAMDWTPSPAAGIERRMLDRLGGEVARATSIVRYAPDSRFPPHVHGGGEEFLVLDGVFSDEHGDFPAGSYIRNPPQSRHAPASAPGCTILVKLWQFDPADRTQVRVDTNKMAFVDSAARPGMAILGLFDDGRESVRLERWDGAAAVDLASTGGLELFVLDGAIAHDGRILTPRTWMRFPPGDRLAAKAGPHGATVWIKTGHLALPPRPPSS